ncbi:hypothetical protein BpHYR1_026817 [Brachionus plicatilis]|uniref:Uncharacterized protein n=1 Tax=Brachionus plicatilis TaxID=10195 RepID=A0A3M7QCK2_BRAPC|nr:hypothetical protein BpHYR1_026817 [Brachionus plicatilis]
MVKFLKDISGTSIWLKKGIDDGFLKKFSVVKWLSDNWADVFDEGDFEYCVDKISDIEDIDWPLNQCKSGDQVYLYFLSISNDEVQEMHNVHAFLGFDFRPQIRNLHMGSKNCQTVKSMLWSDENIFGKHKQKI